MELHQNCANCDHFDGEGWCALPPYTSPPLLGYIGAPSFVVCVKHEPKQQDNDAAEPEGQS